MSAVVQMHLSTGPKDSPSDVYEVADTIAETIKNEAIRLEQIGYKVIPVTITVAPDLQLPRWLTITVRATR